MEVKSIFTIQKLYALFEIFCFSMLFPFILQRFSPDKIIIGFLVAFLTPVLLIIFFKYIPTIEFMFLAVIIRWLSAFIFILKPSFVLLCLYFALYGATFFFFWASYNIRYFNFSNRMNRATSAGHIIIVGPILRSFIPFVSGFVVIKFGHWKLILISAVLILMIIWKTSKIPKLNITYSFREALIKSKGARLLNFIQGIWEAVFWIFPLYTLSFIKGELAFGAFLSYLGIIGVIATLFVTRYSDKQQKRLKFLFPLLIFITFFTMLLSFADSFLKWLIFLGLFNITYILIYPFFFAVVLDKIEDKSASMIIREAMLNTGRAVGILAALLIFYTTGSLQFTFLIIGISPLVYMLVLSRKKVYIDEAYDPLAPVVKVYNGSKQVVAKVYAWGKVVKVKEFALNNVVVKAFTGTKWKTVSLRNISKARLNRFLSGKTSVLFKRMRKTE